MTSFKLLADTLENNVPRFQVKIYSIPIPSIWNDLGKLWVNRLPFKHRNSYLSVQFLRSFVVRKHLTGGFLCAVLDLSGILCSLLIPEYSGIERQASPRD